MKGTLTGKKGDNEVERVSPLWEYLLGGPKNKDYSIWGSILGSPIQGNYLVGYSEGEPRS